MDQTNTSDVMPGSEKADDHEKTVEKPAEGAQEADPVSPKWGATAPKGGRTVFSRMVKEGAQVPLFLAQTFTAAIRDLGYNDTISSLCDHVDNSLEAGAKEIRVYFHERGRKRRGASADDEAGHRIDVLVYDNGTGMPPNLLHAAMSFGGSSRFDSRESIGRFGTGMKAAALSMAPAFEVISWQERSSFYSVSLDVTEIGNERTNVVYVPQPELSRDLPAEVVSILTSFMTFPRQRADQEVLASDVNELLERLGDHGTLVSVPNCDRLTYRTVRTLAEHATRDMARIYRRFLERGVKIYVNNRSLVPFDPTYRMATARHAQIIREAGAVEIQSRLAYKWEGPNAIQVPVAEDSLVTKPITVKLFVLPVEDWERLPTKVKKNDLRLFEGHSILFMRADRELSCGTLTSLVGKHHSRDYWWRLEVDFPGVLDEAFGVNVNKQGVRLKDYVVDVIREAINEHLRNVKVKLDKVFSDRAARNTGGKLNPAEQKANEAEAFQATVLPDASKPSNELEAKELEANLRTLAKKLQREGETEDAALERVKNSRYLTVLRHEPEWDAFYMLEVEFGKVILTLNRAHPFYERAYRPLSELAVRGASAPPAAEGAEADEEESVAKVASDALTALHLVLLALGRTQSVMTANNDELRPIFDRLRKQWGANLAEQLGAK